MISTETYNRDYALAYKQGAKDFARWLVEDSNICDVTCDSYINEELEPTQIIKILLEKINAEWQAPISCGQGNDEREGN